MNKRIILAIASILGTTAVAPNAMAELNENSTLSDVIQFTNGLDIRVNNTFEKASDALTTREQQDGRYNELSDRNFNVSLSNASALHYDNDKVVKTDENLKDTITGAEMKDREGNNLKVRKLEKGSDDITLRGDKGTGIHNLRDGVADKDAVNVSQLNKVDQTAKAAQANANATAAAIGDTNNKVKFLGEDVKAVAKTASNADLKAAGADAKAETAKKGLAVAQSDIKKLDQTKVSNTTFLADQKRQDDALADTKQQMKAADDNLMEGVNQAHTLASSAYENTGILMNETEDLRNTKADKGDLNSLQSTVTSNRQRVDTQVGLLKGEINTKVDGTVYMNQVAYDDADRKDLRDQTQKLWSDKASQAALDNEAGARTEETAERIKGYNDLDERKADRTELQASYNDLNDRKAEKVDVQKAQSTAEVAVAKSDNNTAAIKAVGAQTVANTQDIVTLNNAVNNNAVQGRAYTDQQVGEVSRKVDGLKAQQDKDRTEYRNGLAATAAMANIPGVAGHKFDLGVGLGNFANSTAVAVGMHYRPSENNVFQMSAAAGNSGKGVVGLGYSYGF